eukprot:270503_1
MKRTHKQSKETNSTQKATEMTITKPPLKKRKKLRLKLTFRNNNTTTDKLIELDMIKYLINHYKPINESYTHYSDIFTSFKTHQKQSPYNTYPDIFRWKDLTFITHGKRIIQSALQTAFPSLPSVSTPVPIIFSPISNKQSTHASK